MMEKIAALATASVSQEFSQYFLMCLPLIPYFSLSLLSLFPMEKKLEKLNS